MFIYNLKTPVFGKQNQRLVLNCQFYFSRKKKTNKNPQKCWPSQKYFTFITIAFYHKGFLRFLELAKELRLFEMFINSYFKKGFVLLKILNKKSHKWLKTYKKILKGCFDTFKGTVSREKLLN